MALWIIGDPHLDLTQEKPMSVFGSQWENHAEKIRQNWEATVGAEDTVIVAGDISWAINLEDAGADLAFLDRLPGRRKILLRGNHDYWWSTLAKAEHHFRSEGLTSLELFQNEAIFFEDLEQPTLMIGTRGWKLPTDDDFKAQDRKIYLRELERLKLSIKAADQFLAESALDPAQILSIAVMHFPPVTKDGRPSDLSTLLVGRKIRTCYYGHVHGTAGKQSFRGVNEGICYQNIACDQVDFTPQLITV